MNLTWCAFPIKSSQNAPLWVAWTSDTWRWWNSQHLAPLVAVYGKSSLQNIRLRRRLFKSISACLACQTCQESDWFSNTNMDTRTVHTYYTHHLLSCPGLRNIIHSLDSCHLLPKEEPFVKKRKVVQSMLTLVHYEYCYGGVVEIGANPYITATHIIASVLVWNDASIFFRGAQLLWVWWILDGCINFPWKLKVIEQIFRL